MLRTKNIASNLEEVPSEWIFEHYLGLDRLAGQEVWMKSIFNGGDDTPSMHVYMTPSKIYRFKDFSTGKGGDGVDLVRELIRMEKGLQYLPPPGEAHLTIVTTYNAFAASGSTRESRELKIHSRYKVCGHQKRKWNTDDVKYWRDRYDIGSNMLSHYNVQPLEKYDMQKDEDGRRMLIEITGPRLYGYFRKDGSLYKIYQPMIRKRKFIQVRDYIQGTDQLTFKKPNLVICSSLKDLMCLMQMGFKTIEAVAPNSENTPIPKQVIHSYLHKYRNVCTLFDNDDAGRRSMDNYRNEYGLPSIIFEVEKDIAEAVKEFGMKKTKEEIYKVLLPVLKK